MNNIPHLFLAAVALSSCAFAANTATQTFVLGQTAESFSQQFAFSQFNPALGTLTSIHFSLQGSEVGNSNIRNGSGASGTYTYNNQADLYITDLLGTIFNESFPGTNQSAVIAAGATRTFTGVSASSSADAYFTGNGVGSFQLTTYIGNGSPDSTINSAQFIGAGLVNLVFNGDNTSTCTGTSAVCSNTSGTGGGSVTLFYDYTPTIVSNTPEPATISLLGSALIGLAFVKFRRKTV